MSRRPHLAALFLSLAVAASPGAFAVETLAGKPRIVDADTLEIAGERIRLEGIDAPESRQQCEDAEGVRYACGRTATDALRKRIGGEPVTCEGSERGRYGRLIAVCRLPDETDLNGWLVREGLALAYRHYSDRYVAQEAEAKAAKRGLWAGAFVPPWDWRRGERL